MRIDAHQHFWQIGKYDYAWMNPSMGVLYKDYGASGLWPLLKRNDIACSVLVQTISSLDETKWFLELAREHAFIGGVVGWVDLTDDGVGAVLDELTADPGFIGVRHQVHDEPDDKWLLHDDVMRGLGELQKRRIPYDLLIRPQHLEVSIRIANKFPQHPLVVDHIAKPNIADRQWDDWAAGMSALAACDNVLCKLSGMITEASQDWKPADIRPYVEYLVDIFGPARCMFGSDWPVCLLAGNYEQIIDTLQQSVNHLSSSEQEEIFGGTADRFYGLETKL